MSESKYIAGIIKIPKSWLKPLPVDERVSIYLVRQIRGDVTNLPGVNSKDVILSSPQLIKENRSK